MYKNNKSMMMKTNKFNELNKKFHGIILKTKNEKQHEDK